MEKGLSVAFSDSKEPAGYWKYFRPVRPPASSMVQLKMTILSWEFAHYFMMS